jgi:hypothetical protein
MRKGFLKYEEMRKYLFIQRRPLVIYDSATAPFWISLHMRKLNFLFYQCTWIVIVVFTAVLLICAGGAEAARAVRVEGRLSLEADPLGGGVEAAGAARVGGHLGLEAGPLAGGAEAAREVRVVGCLGLEAEPLAGGGEAAGAARLAGGRHTRRV